MKHYIEDIITNYSRESDVLEFKKYIFSNGKFNSLEPKESNTLIKEICSFANQNGGRIIIGIAEDENHNPDNIIDCQVSNEQFEMWEQSFRNRIATTTVPVLYGIKLHHVEYENQNIIIIDVPKSILSPHAFNNGNKDEFYIRNGNESRPMRYNDLKLGFQALEYTQEKINQFRDSRLSYILSGDLDLQLSEDTSLVIHIIPEWSLDESNYIDLRSCQYNKDFVNISPGRKGSAYFNADGLIDVYGYSERAFMSYIQIFTNGRIESTEIRLLNDYKTNTIYKWFELEEIVVHKIYDYCLLLLNLGVNSSFFIGVSLLNTKGKIVEYNSWGDTSKPITKRIIKTPFVKWTAEDSFASSIFPILISLAHTFGLPKSYFYDDELNPISEKFAFLPEYQPSESE